MGASSRRTPPPTVDAPVPPIEVTIERHVVDAARLSAYRDFCGFEAPSEEVVRTAPLPYLFVLGFLPQAAALTHRALPLNALGMVHLRSSLESFSPLRGGDTIRLVTSTLDWRQARKGWEVDTETRLEDLRGNLLARSLATSLALGGGHGQPRSEERTTRSTARNPTAQHRQAPEAGEHGSELLASWVLPADTGRRYARVSGDWNPIHLWATTARGLGQPRAIAHGIYLLARCVAELESRAGKPGSRVDVEFKTPVRLPGACKLFASPPQESFSNESPDHTAPSRDDPGARALDPGDFEGPHDNRFELWSADGERPHLFGIVTI